MTVTITNDGFIPELGTLDGTAKEIAQNVAVILSTRKGTCPMAREIGLSYSWIGRSLGVAHALVAAEVAEAIAEQEPRARLVGVAISDAGNQSVRIEAEVDLIYGRRN